MIDSLSIAVDAFVSCTGKYKETLKEKETEYIALRKFLYWDGFGIK